MPESSRPILVIGGGPAGLEAARGITELGYKCVLVEMKDVLGGMPVHSNYAALTPDFRDAGAGIMSGVQQFKFMRALFGLGVCAAIGVTVTLFTRPEPKEKLRGLVIGGVVIAGLFLLALLFG